MAALDYLDYPPVYDDEEDLLRNGGYAPAVPDSSAQLPVSSSQYSAPAPSVPDAGRDRLDLQGNVIHASAPAVSSGDMPDYRLGPGSSGGAPPVAGSTGDLESRMGQMAPYRGPENASAPQPQRPQWKDYQPAQPHGWGKVGHALAALLPQTNEYFNVRPEQQAERRFTAAMNDYKAPAAEEAQAAETEEREASAEHNRAETENLRHPAAKAAKEGTPEEATIHDLMTGENGGPRMNPQTSKPYSYLEAYGAVQTAKQGAKPEKEEKETAPQQAAFDDLVKQGLSPVQAYEKIREKPATPGAEAGTWQLGEDKDGKPILWNSKTTETRDSGGISKPGTHEKATQAEAGEQQAINYGKDYLERGVFTGAGDEALQEKFFELAKPKTGFRMSQPQMDMLRNSRDWMSGMEAHVRHATTGTWFSPEQRNQIVSTMQELADARSKPAAGGEKGETQRFSDNGVNYNIPKDKIEAFKKDHPNAR